MGPSSCTVKTSQMIVDSSNPGRPGGQEEEGQGEKWQLHEVRRNFIELRVSPILKRIPLTEKSLYK